ncbi:hypothetical protein AH448_17300 [Salmonella enterica subsp. diarizonae]|uniref:hypothetical protein n=1 Tax=Salmonella enterica TaxID=28901 RepID=UPI0009B13D79|nr:hypothetical protein [Salmonella enterica]EAW1825225.1 hypothetical protein [Salmonella enterica subsp. diarizonae]EDT6983871.1 hypothetical protein [Salmonella enterica subsp. arizonae]EBP1016629.1 hypothetical protein [Salmonella enterica]ECE0305746.1 hypothetical protein [Salmonella enterica subsp. diarizonae]ECO1373314.1 hypothetical protein [Salmonella enterica subsp. diarizonae]
MSTITNNKLTDETLKAWKIEAMISLGETPKDCREYSHHEAIFALVTELQERRKTEAEPIGYMNRFTGRVFSLDEQPGADTDTAVYLPVYTAPPEPVVPEVLERLRSIVADPRALPRRKEWISGQQYSYVLLENVEAMVDEACRAAMLQSKYRDLSQPADPQISEYEKIMLQAGNSPVIPDGYTLVPVEPTDEMIVAAMDSDDVTYNESDDTVFYVHHCEIYKAMLAAAPQPEASDGK